MRIQFEKRNDVQYASSENMLAVQTPVIRVQQGKGSTAVERGSDIPSISALEFRRRSSVSAHGAAGMVHYPETMSRQGNSVVKMSNFWFYFRHVWLDYLELFLPKHWTPYNPVIRIWNWFSIICVMWTLIVTPFMGAFISTDIGLWVIALFCDVCFVMDIFVHFRVPYERSGILVNSNKAIMFTYIFGRRGDYVGIVDILTALPLELLCFIPFGWTNINTRQIAAELRYVKLIRMYRIPIFFGLHENILGSHTFRLRTAKYLIVCLLFTHNAACFWYRSACIGVHSTDDVVMGEDQIDRFCYSPSWASRIEEAHSELKHTAFNSSDSGNISHSHGATPGKFVGHVVNPTKPLYAYTVAIYWAVATTTSTGYGDVASVTMAEVWLASCFMLAGTLFFFGMMVGGLTSIMTNLDKQRAKFVHHLNNVKNIMSEMSISDDLRLLVLGYYEYTWLRNKGVKYERLFDTLPLSFRQEISLQLNHKILDKAAIFSHVGPGFLRMISMYMKHRFYLPGQIISQAGEVGLQMFYIHRGVVEILGEDEEAVVATLKEGRIFGEISLVVNAPRTATIRAGCHCDLVVLEKHDLMCVLKYFPEVLERIRDIADHRYNRVSKAVVSQNRKAQSSVVAVSHSIPQRVFEILHGTSERKMSNTSALFPNLRPSYQHESSYELSKRFNQLIHRQHTVYSDDNMEVYDEEKKLFRPVARESIWQQIKDRVWNKFDYVRNTLVNPESTLFQVWETIILITSVYNGFYVLFLGCFTTNGLVTVNVYSWTWLQAICVIADIFNILDILFQLRTAVHTPNGVFEDFGSIKKYYIHSPRFAMDLLGAVPFDYFAAGEHRQWWFAILKLNRALKLYKVPVYFKAKEESILFNIVTVRIFKFLIYVPLVTHFIACAWFFQACGLRERCEPESWAQLSSAAFNNNTSLTFMYISSFYWATTTMSSTGYGDIVAFNTYGRVVAIIAMVTGLGLWGYLQAAMASTISALDAPRVAFQSKVKMVMRFMKERNLDEELRKKTIKYMTLLWRCHRHEQHSGANVFSEIPLSLQQDMLLCEYGPFLNYVPLFRECDETFLRDLVLRVQQYIYFPGTYIVTAEEVGGELYMIKRGHCEMLIGDRQSKVFLDIGPGNYFGETCVIFGGIHNHSVRAKTHVEVLMLTRTDLYGVLQRFPTILQQFRIAEQNKSFLYQMSKDATAHLVAQKSAKEKQVVRKESSRKAEGHGNQQAFDRFSRFRRQRTKSRHFVQPQENLSNSSFRWFKRKCADGQQNEDYILPFQALHPISKVFAHLLMPVAVLPFGNAIKVFEFIKFLLSLTVIILTGIWFAFEAFFKEGGMQLTMVGLCAINAVFIYLSLHYGFYKQAVLVTHPIACARHYMVTNFLLDFFGTFPFDLIAYSYYINVGDVKEFAIMKSSFFSLTHLLLFYRVPMMFAYYESLIEKHTGLIRLAKFILYMGLFTHFLTCLVNMFACPPALFLVPDRETVILPPAGDICYKDTWIFSVLDDHKTAFIKSHTCRANCTYYTLMGLLTERDKAGQSELGEVLFFYVNALYWASATTLSVGYGDIHPRDQLEMVVSIILMMTGVIFYAYVIAAVAASMANADARRAAFQEKMNNIRSYMKDFFTEDTLQTRVINHYEHVWQRTGDLEPSELLKGLPYSLWGDVTFNLYKQIINKVTLFQNAEKGFKKMLSRSIQPMSYLKGEFIVKQGDPGNVMFFIHHGVAEITDEEGDKVISTLNPGRFFGEVSLLFEIPRTASIRAKTTVDVFCLTRDSLFEVMDHYNVFKKQIFAIATVKRLKAVEGLAESLGKWTQEQFEKFVQNCLWKNPSLLIDPDTLVAKCKDATPDNPHISISEDEGIVINLLCPYSLGWWVSPAVIVIRVYMWQMLRSVHYTEKIYKKQPVTCILLMPQPETQDTNDNFIVSTDVGQLSFNVSKVINRVEHESKARQSLSRNNISENTNVPVPKITVYEANTNYNASNQVISGASSNSKNVLVDATMSGDTNTRKHNFCGGCGICTDVYGSKNINMNYTKQPTNNFATDAPTATRQKNEHESIEERCAFWTAEKPKEAQIHDLISQIRLKGSPSRNGSAKERENRFKTEFGYTPQVSLRLGKDMDITENFIPLGDEERKWCDVIVAMFDKREQETADDVSAEQLDFFREIVTPNSNFMSSSDSDDYSCNDSDSEETAEEIPFDQPTIENNLSAPTSEQDDLMLLSYCKTFEENLYGRRLMEKDVASPHQSSTEANFKEGNEQEASTQYFKSFNPHDFVTTESMADKENTTGEIFDATKASLQWNENARFRKNKVLTVYDSGVADTPEARLQRASVQYLRAQKDRVSRSPTGTKQHSLSSTGEKNHPPSRQRMCTVAKESLGNWLREELAIHATAPRDSDHFFKDSRTPSSGTAMWKCLDDLEKWNTFVVIPHHNRRYKYFRHCLVFLGFVMSILQIYWMAFAQPYPSEALFYTTSLVFYFEIFIKFHLSFQDSSGLNCEIFRAVYRKYLFSYNGFWIDVLKEFPFEIVAVLFPTGDTRRYLLIYLRVNRTLRIVRSVQYVQEWESELNINVLLVRLYKYTIIFLTAVHTLAVLWCMIACFHECRQGSWATKRGIDKMEYINRYANAIYWTMATMTSTGYGDISAYRLSEKAFAALVMFLGKLMFGFILATISATLANAEVKHIYYEEKLTAIRTHLNDQQVSPELQRHVITYFAHLWKRNSGTDIKELLHDAPYPLQSEFYLYLTEDFLRKVPILEDVSKALLRHLAVCVRHVMLIEGDFLVRKGDVNNNIFYIHRGKCIVVHEHEDDNDEDDELREGDFFGQVNLVFSIPCCSSIRCATHVDIFTLSKESMDEAKELFPDCAKGIEKLERDLYNKYESFQVTPGQNMSETDLAYNLDLPQSYPTTQHGSPDPK